MKVLGIILSLIGKGLLVLLAIGLGSVLGGLLPKSLQFLQVLFLLPAIGLFLWLSGDKWPARWKIVWFAILGCLFGSLANLVFHRLPDSWSLIAMLLLIYSAVFLWEKSTKWIETRLAKSS